jgi:hypothetical protein
VIDGHTDGSGQKVHELDRSGVECGVAQADAKSVTNSAETEERLDRLAEQLGRAVQLLQAGSGGVAVKDQLAKLHRALLEVVKDTGLDPSDVVQRDIETSTRPASAIPQPFRPVDMSAFAINR